MEQGNKPKTNEQVVQDRSQRTQNEAERKGSDTFRYWGTDAIHLVDAITFTIADCVCTYALHI